MKSATPNDANEPALVIRFWGTGGGIAAHGAERQRYGGHTPCVEVRCGPHLLILDAGTGLRLLGDELVAGGEPVDADILLSHTHLDHVVGIGFFQPLYRPTSTLRFHAGHLPPGGLRQVVHTVLTHPLAPDLLNVARARLQFHEFAPRDDLNLRPGLTVRTAALRHPGGATGYRIMWNAQSVVYITDTEHDPEQPDSNVLELIRDADAMIYDTSYTDEEFETRRGWGHSTWQEAIRLADAARVSKLILFHHNTARTDEALDRIASEAARARPGTISSFDGLVVTL
nr:MBL fold metallo-hydrolase [uncultured Rhodopila sp.]